MECFFFFSQEGRTKWGFFFPSWQVILEGFTRLWHERVSLVSCNRANWRLDFAMFRKEERAGGFACTLTQTCTLALCGCSVFQRRSRDAPRCARGVWSLDAGPRPGSSCLTRYSAESCRDCPPTSPFPPDLTRMTSHRYSPHTPNLSPPSTYVFKCMDGQ